MPVVIPYVVYAAIVSAAVTAATVALEMVALMLVSKLLAPKSSQGTQLSDGVTQEYSGTVEPRRMIYGTNLVSGLNAIPPWCHGQNNALLDQVLVLAGHEVTSITDVYANQELILSKNIGAITQSVNDGKVATGTFANKLWLRRHTGAPTEQIDFILYQAWPASWDINHMGLGLAKIFIQYQYDATVYSGGKPEIRCMVKGKKCYDPRLDTLPGANPTNVAYKIFTANPALCIVDFLLDPILGLGEATTRVDWTMAVAAANCCDEQVAVPLLLSLIPIYDPLTTYYFGDQVQQGGVVYDCVSTTSIVNHAPPNVLYWNPLGTGSLTQPRYTCNTVLDCTLGYEENLKTLAASMQGAVLYSSGKWVLYPGKWQTPSFVIGDDDITGALDFQTAIPYADRYNAVRGQFYDPTNLYQPGEYPAIEVQADEIADGEGPVWRELQQPHCIDIFEAQRNAIVLQRKSRRKKTWAFPATYGMWGIRPGDFGTLTITELGIVGQYVRCTGWKMDGKAMSVQLTLEEVNPTDWFDPATVIYQTATNLANPAPAWFTSDPVTNLTGVGGAGGITFRWLMPPIWHSNLSIELLESDTNLAAGAPVIWSGVNTGVFIQKGDTVARYYWVRVRNFAGNTLSGTQPPSSGLLVAATTAGQGPPGPPGPPGDGGLVGSLTLPVIVLPADAYGNVTDYSTATGYFKVFQGTVDVTAQCIFALGPAGNPSGLTFTIDGLAGEASLGQIVTAQSQTVVGINPMVYPTGTSTTAQGQVVLAGGSGGISYTWDSDQVTWDSSHPWSDNTGSFVPFIPVAVSGAGSSGQAERVSVSGTYTAPIAGAGFTPTISIKGKSFVNGPNGTGNIIQLRGANMSALEYTAIQGWSPTDPWGGSGQAPNWSVFQTFKPNCVRLPLNVASWMGYTVAPTASATTWGATRSADPGGNYRATVIKAVADAQAIGCYVILDLHWTSPPLTLGGVTQYLANTGQSAFADATAIPFWTSIAQTFGTQATPQPGVSNFGVLFELFNEPYAKSFSGTCTTGPNGTGSAITDKDVLLRTGGYSNLCVNQSQGGANFSLAVNWQIVGYQAMLDAIRATGAQNVCITNGNDYAQSLKPYASFKPVDAINQVAIGWHPYPNRYQTNCTITSGNPSIVASTSLAAGQPVGFTGSVGNIAVDTTYYVSATGLSGSALQICATPGGAVIVPNANGNVGLNRNHYPYTNYGPIPVCGSDNGYAAPNVNDVQYANAVLAAGYPVICTEYGGEGGTSRTNVPPEPMVNYVQQWADTSGASALIWQFNNPRAYGTVSSTYYCTTLDATGKQVATQGCGTNWESWMKGHL